MFDVATSFSHVPSSVMATHFFTPLGIKIHSAAAGVALLVGSFQFLRSLRLRSRRLHRWLGRIYVLACVLGGVAGGAIALFSSSGPVAGWGFFTLAVLWVPFTLMAWLSAMNRDFLAHQSWMIRSFALTFGAVTLRLYLPIGIMTAGFEPSYPVIAWLAWVPNLLLAEFWLRMRPIKNPVMKSAVQGPS
ncbi:MAG: DUF2306 domain-containing protein [Hyphomonadaceae bacterium]